MIPDINLITCTGILKSDFNNQDDSIERNIYIYLYAYIYIIFEFFWKLDPNPTNGGKI